MAIRIPGNNGLSAFACAPAKIRAKDTRKIPGIFNSWGIRFFISNFKINDSRKVGNRGKTHIGGRPYSTSRYSELTINPLSSVAAK